MPVWCAFAQSGSLIVQLTGALAPSRNCHATNCFNRTNYSFVFSYGASGFALTVCRGGVLILAMGRAIKRQYLSPLGWAALAMASIAAIALAWTAAYICVQLMSG